MFKTVMKKMSNHNHLTEYEAYEVMNAIVEKKASESQIGGFLTALRMKGETIEEITGCAKVLRAKAEKILPSVEYCIDTCGTGGDYTKTFNISTATAIVAAAGGAVVAKHGNRSVSSKSGSADVLEALGVDISLPLCKIKECIERIGIGFLFAPDFHKSLEEVADVRKELGIRTVFDILGPLVNPANSKGQVLGVFDKALTDNLARVLINLGVERAMVVHGLDGMDEITTTTKTKVSEILGNKVLNYEISPEMFGIKRASKADLKGKDSKENAKTILNIFEGELGPKRDIIVINAAAALYIARAANTMKEGVSLAEQVIDSKKALKKLYELKGFTNSHKQ